MTRFAPNDLKVADIDGLADWQLLVAACHHGTRMGDCVDMAYTYSVEGDTIFCHTQRDKVCLEGDIDLADPWDGLNRYTTIKPQSWQDVVREHLRVQLGGTP